MPATNELLQEGRYRIAQSSTHNGEEKTFEAYDTVRNTNVLVREIPVKLNKVTTVSQRESLQLAFASHAKALTEIEHESLLHVHDFFSEIDRQYLVMEAVEGESLGALLAARKKPFSVAEVTSWADELLDALHYLHSRKPSIIHRNIDPSNVKLHPSGKIKLIGVGVANGSDPEFSSTPSTEGDNLRYSPMEQIWPGLDPASQKVITNSYDDRSERILKQPLDERSDIYSLGATLYFLITGVEPVDPIERSIEILEGKLDPLREPTKVDSEIPDEISDVLMKALEIKRENRYDSAVIMRQVLKTAITRVQEREDEENREQEEAAEMVRMEATAESEPSTDDIAEQKRREDAAEQKLLEAEAEDARREAEAEQQLQKELMEQQLREAEEQRLAAERAAESERLLREKEETERAARAVASNTTKVPEDNLLDIPVAADVVRYRDTPAVEEADLAAVLRELEEADAAGAESAHHISAREKMEAEDVLVLDGPIDLAPQSSESSHTQESDNDESENIFTVPEKAGYSLPMPAIAAAIGLVVMLAVGGWFMMSGSSEPPKLEAAPAVQVAPQDPVESNLPADSTITSSPAESDSATSETSIDPKLAAVKTGPTPKAKKADAAKPAPDKKKVTVDDLINDN
ncbi:MAG: protein kinase [Acidobacteriota bacterium]